MIKKDQICHNLCVQHSLCNSSLFAAGIINSIHNIIFIYFYLFYYQLVDTTVELANKVGASEIINRIVDDLKDENEQYRKMVMETIEKVGHHDN